jgi:hypothetical protein
LARNAKSTTLEKEKHNGNGQHHLNVRHASESFQPSGNRQINGSHPESAVKWQESQLRTGRSHRFFAAQGHTQRSNDLAIRKDEMSEAIQTIKAADNGINAVLDLIASAKSLAQSALANQSTTERGSLTAQYNRPDLPDRHRGGGLQLQRHQPARWYRPGTQYHL